MNEKTKKLNVKRWFLVTIGLILLLMGITVWMLFFTDLSYSITVSPETTVITEPLFPDGRVDYGSAINEINGRGVTPETNSVIPFAKLIGGDWYDDLEPEQFALFCERLGVKPEDLKPNFTDPVFIDYDNACEDYLTEMEKNWTAEANGQEAIDAVSERIDQLKDEIERVEYTLYDEPWSAEKYPFAARWLEKNDEVLASMAIVIERPDWYHPLTTTADTSLVEMLLPLVSEYREIARTFASRAMLRIDRGELDAAWRDIRTIKQLARHTAGDAFLISYLLGAAIEGVAFSPTAALLAHPSLDDQRRRKIIEEIDQLGRMPMLVESSAWTTEHYFGLEFIQLIPRHGFEITEGYYYMDNRISPYDRAMRNVLRRRINWDAILRRFNEYVKEQAEVMKGPNRPNRIRELEAVNHRQISKDASGRPNLANLIFTSNPTDRVWNNVFLNLSTTYPIVAKVEDRLIAWQRILEIVWRLALYRDKQREYPDSLDILMKEPLGLDPPSADLLEDPFSETGQFQYKKNPDGEEGYLIYSIGRNNVDDGGRWTFPHEIAVTERDDITVRVGPDGYVPPSVWNVDPPEEDDESDNGDGDAVD